MKSIGKLLKNTFLFRGQRAYTITEALLIMTRERNLKQSEL